MLKSEYNERVREICEYVNNHEHDDMLLELNGRNIKNVFTYARWCEVNFEANLREDYERKTTYTSDFSIAEWCVPYEGMSAIADTLKRALKDWRDDIEWLSEIIIVLNMKAWEHAARKNVQYADMYSHLYLEVKYLFFDWFDKSNPQHDKAIEYYYNYVD